MLVFYLHILLFTFIWYITLCFNLSPGQIGLLMGLQLSNGHLPFLFTFYFERDFVGFIIDWGIVVFDFNVLVLEVLKCALRVPCWLANCRAVPTLLSELALHLHSGRMGWVIVFNSEKVCLTIFTMVGKDLSGIRIRCSSLLLVLASFLGYGRASVPAHILRAYLHISIHWALLLGPEEARVVLCEVFLLSVAHLATHDKSRAQLNGLGLYEARVREIITLAIWIKFCWWWLYAGRHEWIPVIFLHTRGSVKFQSTHAGALSGRAHCSWDLSWAINIRLRWFLLWSDMAREWLRNSSWRWFQSIALVFTICGNGRLHFFIYETIRLWLVTHEASCSCLVCSSTSVLVNWW